MATITLSKTETHKQATINTSAITAIKQVKNNNYMVSGDGFKVKLSAIELSNLLHIQSAETYTSDYTVASKSEYSKQIATIQAIRNDAVLCLAGDKWQVRVNGQVVIEYYRLDVCELVLKNISI